MSSAPQNTLASLQAALDAGLDGVEFDVRITRDGALVLQHDPVDAQGRAVYRLSLSELREDQPDLLTLAEAVQALPTSAVLNVEIKDHGIAEAVLEALAEVGDDRLLISSFHDETLTRVRAARPEVRLGLLVGGRPRDLSVGDLYPWARAARLGDDVLVLCESRLARWLVHHSRPAGRPFGVWSPSTMPSLRHWASQDLDVLITDEPVRALVACGRPTR